MFRSQQSFFEEDKTAENSDSESSGEWEEVASRLTGIVLACVDVLADMFLFRFARSNYFEPKNLYRKRIPKFTNTRSEIHS